ncbi:MAG: cupin domain-containing protein [Proteobacteria bacterium]|nr:cupin domain-containing protein [Pseudomonadota bacterium]
MAKPVPSDLEHDMSYRTVFAWRIFAALALGLAFSAPRGAIAEPLVIKPLAEARVASLPSGTLFWRIEQFESAAAARAAAGPWSLVAESAGKVWLFTLGPAGGASVGTKIAEVGPIPRIEANHYLLRINDASGPNGSVTAVHSHPGSEAFFVLQGQQSIRSRNGTLRVDAGHAEAGQGAGQAMQVSSSGATDLHALVMFVVDADQPFSTPATLP